MSSKFLTVMLSSRCVTKIQYKGTNSTLSEVRKKAKCRVEEIEIGGEKLFNCWINELAPSEEGIDDAWEKCLKEASKADIFIAIYNGDAGWTKSSGGIGICHAELQKAFTTNPSKVHLIKLPYTPRKLKGEHKRMDNYIDQLNLFRSTAGNGEQVIEEILAALGEITRRLVKSGAKSIGASNYHLGQALDWNRLDFVTRKNAIEKVLFDSLKEHPSGSVKSSHVFLMFGSKKILFRCHGIPAAMSVAAARELVGQPFLQDFELDVHLTGSAGPVHLIGCHRGVSESQATAMLGHPDAIVVDAKVGIYVADQIQKTQLILLRNCRDESSTRHAVQRMLDWLERSGEVKNLAARAISRSRICKLIAKENC